MVDLKSSLPRFRAALRRWHKHHGRDLPWRALRDPYRVWVSEIMLQQTTVTAVRPYYERFLARFPTLHDLAAASEEEVLRLWEGLGYYSRGRNLRRAAQLVVAEHGGMLPADVEALRRLPGVGRYTAGAIASFAHDRPAPIVEANTLRLYCRLLGYDGDPRSAEGQRLLWDFAAAIVPKTAPGEFNQALMDLGATVCTPTAPRCDVCPVTRSCSAFRSGRQNEIPRAARRPDPTHVTEATVAVRDRGRYLVRRYQPGERWAGLWDFIRFPLRDAAKSKRRSGPRTPASDDHRPRLGPLLSSEVHQRVAELTGLSAEIESLLMELRHGVTRYRIRLICLTAARSGGRLRRDGEFRWLAPRELAEVPLSVTGRKVARRLAAAAPTER